MSKQVYLPKLLRLALCGMRPIFSRDINMPLLDGVNLVLGGNGLGKTTLMQAVVYALTGGNHGVEGDKHRQWDHKYFHKRLSLEWRRSAYVEVEFLIGKVRVGVRRGFYGPHLTAFRLVQEGEANWITDDPEKHYLSALNRYGGYASEDDFRFLVHRLLYLPESRQLLAWDFDSQLRAMMSLNPDLVDEENFRKQRERLKNLDSEKRHLRVAINKLEEYLTPKGVGSSSSSAPLSASSEMDRDESLEVLIPKLAELARARLAEEEKQREATLKLAEISEQVESLQEGLELAESALAARLMSSQEKNNALALHKLTASGVCPACGTIERNLQEIAIERLRNHLCTICGSNEPQLEHPNLSTLLSQLTEKTRSKSELESEVTSTTRRVQSLFETESELRRKVNTIRLRRLDVASIERDYSITPENPEVKRRELLKQEEELEVQIREGEAALERRFAAFSRTMSERVQWLKKRYGDYATSFLGVTCNLIETPMAKQGKLFAFVPEFNGIIRESPESCSEAQRFFLDIAFRMSLVDYAAGRCKLPATFLCETPENALDISYVDNVVEMFMQFARKGNSLLLTTNVQRDGIAKKLLARVPKRRRKRHLLNLVEIGALSDVQKAALPEINSIIADITS